MATETKQDRIVWKLQQLGISLSHAETVGVILLILEEIEHNKEALLKELKLKHDSQD